MHYAKTIPEFLRPIPPGATPKMKKPRPFSFGLGKRIRDATLKILCGRVSGRSIPRGGEAPMRGKSFQGWMGRESLFFFAVEAQLGHFIGKGIAVDAEKCRRRAFDVAGAP